MNTHFFNNEHAHLVKEGVLGLPEEDAAEDRADDDDDALDDDDVLEVRLIGARVRNPKGIVVRLDPRAVNGAVAKVEADGRDEGHAREAKVERIEKERTNRPTIPQRPVNDRIGRRIVRRHFCLEVQQPRTNQVRLGQQEPSNINSKKVCVFLHTDSHKGRVMMAGKTRKWHGAATFGSANSDIMMRMY